jgi:protoporphyrinogen IX oxidase
VMMNIGGTLSWLFGACMLLLAPALFSQGWMEVKLVLVLALTGYHFWCAAIVKQLARDEAMRSHVWYRWFNEFPTLILIAVVILAVVKPF